MAQTNLPLDADRLWADVMALAEITDPERPYTRRSFTALFLEGRAWLAGKFAEAGLTTRIDTAGNLIGRLEGSDQAVGAECRRVDASRECHQDGECLARGGLPWSARRLGAVAPRRARLLSAQRTRRAQRRDGRARMSTFRSRRRAHGPGRTG